MSDEGTSDQERGLSRVISEYVTSGRVNSVHSLVSAYNEASEDSKRAELWRWLVKFIEWFEDHGRASTFTSIVEEYSAIAWVQPKSTKDKEMLESFYLRLSSLVQQKTFGDEKIVKALCSALHDIHRSVFKIVGLVPLHGIVSALLLRVGPMTTLTRDTYQSLKPTLEAIHQALVVAYSISTKKSIKFQPGGFYHTTLDDVTDIKQRSFYYPFEFQALRIERLLDGWRMDSVPERNVFAKERFWQGVYGFASLLGSSLAVKGRYVDAKLIEDGIRYVKNALSAPSGDRPDWYDLLRSLAAAICLATRDPARIELFEEVHGDIKASIQSFERPADIDALHFGIVDLLSQAMMQVSCQQLQERAETLLLEFGKVDSLDKVSDDVSEAYFDALLDLYGSTRKPNSVAATFEALSSDGCDKLKVSYRDWLDDDTLQEKLARSGQRETVQQSTVLFDTVKKEAGVSLTFEDVENNVAALKSRYKHPAFSEVPPMFGGETNAHVKGFEHDLAYFDFVSGSDAKSEGQSQEHLRSEKPIKGGGHVEQHHRNKLRIKKPITLGDIFKKRALRGGEQEEDVKTVLVHGDPGSGKTSVSKRLAFDWADGRWGLEFARVYHLEMRAVENDRCGDRSTRRHPFIETAIANCCFDRGRDPSDYNRLIAQIERDVADPSTLIIIDGLDECSELGKRIKTQAIKCESRLIMLSRPYDLNIERKSADLEIECLGMNDAQLDNFLSKELPSNVKRDVVEKLRDDASLWIAAHIPVTAHILCHIYKELSTEKQVLGINHDMYSMYNTMVSVMWKRFLEKFGRTDVEKTATLVTLERLAFSAYKEGKILIGRSIVHTRAISGTNAEAIRQSGLLLLSLDGSCFHFPHLTFQEFFVAVHIVRCTLEDDDVAKSEVAKWITDNKYSPKSKVILRFAAQALYASQKENGIDKMYSLVDDKPVEFFGVMHTMLRLRIVDSFLSYERGRNVSQLWSNEKTVGMYESVKKLIRTATNDHSGLGRWFTRELNINLREMPNLLREKPELIDHFIESISLPSRINRLNSFTAVSEIAKFSPQKLEVLIDIIDQKRTQQTSWQSKVDANQAMQKAIKTNQTLCSKVQRIAIEGYGDEDSRVHEAAMNTLLARAQNDCSRMGDQRMR